MTGIISLWGHLLAATLYGALALWQLRQWHGNRTGRPLVTAFTAMSVWSIFLAYFGADHFLTSFAECARNLAFLSFMYGLVRNAEAEEGRRTAYYVYAGVAAVIGLQIVASGLLAEFRGDPRATDMLLSLAYLLGLAVAAGGLVLVHNLYGQSAPDAQAPLRLPMLALAVIWVYDLHLYTIAHLNQAPPAELFAMRGVVLAMVVPLFACALRRGADGWRIRLSRSATFQSLSLIAILVYLVAMMAANRAIALAGGDWASIAQIALICAMSLGAVIFLPSPRARAWLKVMTAKHFFEHRYDYRREWLRFTGTIADGGQSAEAIETRALRAMANLCDSPAALLLVPDEEAPGEEALTEAARWGWAGPPARGAEEGLVRFLADTGHVLDFSRTAQGGIAHRDGAVPVPRWLAALDGAWAGIPLVQDRKFAGLVVLARPPLARALDWEDFDLLRTAGMQAAAQLAEARAQQALAETRRFDEFNRRFAFVLHDLKNLVSQLSLVARNAERHAGNPEFQADMVMTLQGSVKKMNDLLARLAPGARGDSPALRPIPAAPLIRAVAEVKNRLHPVTCLPGPNAWTRADSAQLQEAIGHLVQNGIDASAPGSPVRIGWRVANGDLVIDIADRGEGMSAAFIRSELFRPFSSTKPHGFGIGAYEARTLIAAMGGRLAVESAQGEGSRFTIILPCARGEEIPAGLERMSA